MNGELVGVSTAIVGPSGGNIGIGFFDVAEYSPREWCLVCRDPLTTLAWDITLFPFYGEDLCP